LWAYSKRHHENSKNTIGIDFIRTARALIRKNNTKDVTIITPERMLLAGKLDGEITDGTIRVASYSQEVAEEILELMTK